MHRAPHRCIYSFQFHDFREGTSLVRAEPLEVLYTCKFLFIYVFFIYTINVFRQDLWNTSKTGAVKSSVVVFLDATRFQTRARTHSSSIKSPVLPLQFIACRHSHLESELIMLLPSLNFGALSL